jgi:hypothetical protein
MVYTVFATFENSGKEAEVYFTIDVDEFKIIEINYEGRDKSLSEMLSADAVRKK